MTDHPEHRRSPEHTPEHRGELENGPEHEGGHGPDPERPSVGEEFSTTDIDRELALGDEALQTSLRALLAPPPDIEDRVTNTVTQQLIGRSAAGTALDLLGLGVRTFAWFLTDGDEDADRSREDAYDDPSPAPQRRPGRNVAP